MSRHKIIDVRYVCNEYEDRMDVADIVSEQVLRRTEFVGSIYIPRRSATAFNRTYILVHKIM